MSLSIWLLLVAAVAELPTTIMPVVVPVPVVIGVVFRANLLVAEQVLKHLWV
jgi:hypothetical protein